MPSAPESAPALRSVTRHSHWVMPRVVLALILREMSSTHGKSPGGYLWMVLEPVLGIALLSAIFSLGFRHPRLGTNFPIFYASGLLPFYTTMITSVRTAQAVNYSRSLLAYPRVSFLDTLIARFTLAAMTQVLVSIILFTGILLVFDTRTVLEMSRAANAYGMALAFGFGLGTLNCFLMTMFPLWQQIWGIATRPLLLMSGVIFLYEPLPEWVQDILWYNPLMHVTGEMRGALYLQYEASYVTPAYVYGVSAGLFLLGLIFLQRYHRDMMER